MVTVLLMLIVWFSSDVLLGDEMKFVEDRIKCFGNIVYETKDVEQRFLYYQNSSGLNELDCARKCFQKLQFCHAVRFDYVTKRCLYSYKIVGPCLPNDEKPKNILPKKDVKSIIIHCIRCDGRTERVTEVPKIEPAQETRATKKLYYRPSYVNFQSTKFPNENNVDRLAVQASNSENSVKFSEYGNIDQDKQITVVYAGEITKQSSKEIILTSTEKPLLISDQKDSPYSNVQQTVQPTGVTLDSSQVYEILSRVDVRERIPQPQFKHILPVIKEKSEDKLILNIPEPFSSNATDPRTGENKCNDDLLSPCISKTGRDCVITASSQKCSICICPLKSPARGCSGAQGLTPGGRLDLLLGRKKCPEGGIPQPVIRYIRMVDSSKNVDDCTSTIQPYCGYLMDVKYWRMPRTKNECYYYCYTDEELKMRKIDVDRLRD